MVPAQGIHVFRGFPEPMLLYCSPLPQNHDFGSLESLWVMGFLTIREGKDPQVLAWGLLYEELYRDVCSPKDPSSCRSTTNPEP